MTYFLIFLIVYAVPNNLLAGAVTMTVLKGKPGMAAGGILLSILWIVAAIRLAMPGSVWARTFYGPAKLNESVRRFPVDRTRPYPRPALEVPAPAQINRGVMLASAAGFVGLAALPNLAIILIGPLLPFAALAGRGVGWARATTITIAAAMAASTLLVSTLSLPGVDPRVVVVTACLQLLLTVAAAHQLCSGDARRYFRQPEPTG